LWGWGGPPPPPGRGGARGGGGGGGGGPQPLKISPEFRYLGVQMARQVETRGAALTMAEVRRRELIDKVHGEGKRMNLLRVSAADPVMTPLDTRQVYLGNCLESHSTRQPRR
jgi:hypothetical protein